MKLTISIFQKFSKKKSNAKSTRDANDALLEIFRVLFLECLQEEETLSMPRGELQ
jgi:hypothetical protein